MSLSGSGFTTSIIVGPVPVPIPVGDKGCTCVNEESVPIIISTSELITVSNSWTLPPNGASYPLPAGVPYFASAPSQTMMIVVPQILNIFNPNVLSEVTPPGLIFGPTSFNTETIIDDNIPIPTSTRTIIISFMGMPLVPDNPVFCVVSGVTTGFFYRGILPFYLKVPPNYLAVIPISGAVEEAINVLINELTGVSTVSIYADSSIYDESVFYNGPVAAASGGVPAGGGPLTILNGPCRLISAHLNSDSSPGNSFMSLNDGITNHTFIGQLGNGDTVYNFAVPTILIDGDSINLSQVGGSSGGVHGDIIYAYP